MKSSRFLINTHVLYTRDSGVKPPPVTISNIIQSKAKRFKLLPIAFQFWYTFYIMFQRNRFSSSIIQITHRPLFCNMHIWIQFYLRILDCCFVYLTTLFSCMCYLKWDDNYNLELGKMWKGFFWYVLCICVSRLEKTEISQDIRSPDRERKPGPPKQEA
jgi:hypothetical protein